MRKSLAIIALSLATCLLVPFSAFAAEPPEDGSYSVAVELGGGSGKATVESPASLEVENGEMTAEIVWSSSNYDLMVVDGTEYQPTTIDGGSTFEIPVSALDEALPVSAETVAMGSPHMIDYTLTFDSTTLQASSDDAPSAPAAAEEAAPASAGPSPVLIVGGCIVAIVVIAAIVLVVRRKGGR